jgi:beta-1,3-galactosyltransferase
VELESISAVRIGGDVLAMSVMANGLPMPKKSIPIPDHLKAPLTALDDEKVEMLIGVTSDSIQFERRMGIRRTWAQYPEIRSGRAMLRFFVGLVSFEFSKKIRIENFYAPLGIELLVLHT